MDKQIVPFPLEDNPFETKMTVSPDFLSLFALHALWALEETGYTSMVVWQGTPPPMPYRKGKWEMKPVEDEYTLPFEVQRNINIIRNNKIPIKQILIAHDITPVLKKEEREAKEVERQHQRLVEAQKREEKRQEQAEAFSGTWRVLKAITVILVAGVAFVAVLPILIQAALTLLVGVLQILAALLLPLCLLIAIPAGLICGWDPICICVLDDPQESWVVVGTWYE